MSPQILSLINEFKKTISKKLHGSKDKVEHFLESGILQYLESQKAKQEYTKTFLFRDEQIQFYETYFPVSLTDSPISAGKSYKKESTQENCFSIFEKSHYHKSYIMIIGYAGSGKSMLMKHFFLDCINKSFKIPIFIELRTFNNFRGSFLEYLTSILFIDKVLPYENTSLLKIILPTGNFLFLLDGFDEIFSEHKMKILEDLNNFIDTYHENLFIITSRPGTNIESLSRFNNFYVAELDNIEIPLFIEQQLKNIDKNLALQIITTIEKPENEEYFNYLKSPLLLSMFILTYNSHPELPRTKAEFYWNVFDTLLTKHDSIKMPGYKHQRISDLFNGQIETLIKWFSFISFFEGQYSFHTRYLQDKFKVISEKLKIALNFDDLLYDLSVSIALFVKDGIEYRFPHRTLQEYFASVLISEQKSEVKEKIYKEKFKKLEQRSNTGNENFLNLCAELDKNAFYKNWIIPNLQSHLSLINIYDENGEFNINKSIIHFFSLIEIEGSITGTEVEVAKDKKELRELSELKFTQEKNFPIIKKLFTVLKMPTDFNVPNLLNQPIFLSNCDTFFRELITEKVLNKNYLKSGELVSIYNFSTTKLWNSGFYSLIEKSSIPQEFNIYVAAIKEKIQTLEAEVEDSERTQIDLLEL